MQKLKDYLSLGRNIKIIIAVLVAITLFVGTYFYIENNLRGDEQSLSIFFVLAIDLVLFSCFIVFLFRRIFFTKIAQERTLYGSRLQKRILWIFGLLSGLPILILSIIATVFLYYVVESWFDKKITAVLEESVLVAESYIKETQDMIKMKTQSIAAELDENIVTHDIGSKPGLFLDVLNSFVMLNDVSEAVVFHGHTPIARSRYGISLSFERLPDEYYKRALSGEVVIFQSRNRLRAMTTLRSMPNSFLVVGKHIDNVITEHIKKSQSAAEKYKAIKNNILELQLKFAIAFLMTSIILLLIAGSIGLSFSKAIVEPIIRLVLATNKVKEGIFSVKLPEGPENDEIANLSRAFNLMTERISEQQRNLIHAYNEIDYKVKFVEMVLSGVSTGIIVLSDNRKVKLINASGTRLLELDKKQTTHLDISRILPESVELIDKICNLKVKEISGEIKSKVKGKILTFLIKIGIELDKDNNIISYIIAFDDMTQLIRSQRYEAWSDIARRIAHEVKNPLTPIHLGAERIKQKYSKYIKDQKNFNMYINTIIRHAEDIREIIEEFSRFARMPAPVFEEIDLSKLVTDIVFSRKIVGKGIKFETKIEENVTGFFDTTQMRQLLTNIIKNSEESLLSMTDSKKKKVITISLTKKPNAAQLVIEDTGKGFPPESINKITEPYFTTKTKGTGLGLAIVKKIVDDHEGELIMKNTARNNAVVEIVLPTNLIDKKSSSTKKGKTNNL
jgi:two-component system nitrogen regulation sensor histidine kinase NtrY